MSVLTDLGLVDAVRRAEHQDMYGIIFSSPNAKVVPVPSVKSPEEPPPGFVCRREVFDNILFQNAKSMCAKTIEGFTVTDVLKEGERVVGVSGIMARAEGEGKALEFRADVVVGADGAGSVVARKLGSVNGDEAHQCAAARAYYENVEGLSDKIELHFVKESLPGYFWIFPLPNKRANVGIGMIVRDMKKNKVNLPQVMQAILENNPLFKERFKNARRASDMKSWILPLASKRTKIHGHGYVLVGDAASLIDPFSGEGVGNGLTSSRIASRTILKAFGKKDFSEAALAEYPVELFREIGKEVDVNYKMQRLANNEFLLNLVIDKASRSKDVQGLISDALINPDSHKNFLDPMFYIRVIFA